MKEKKLALVFGGSRGIGKATVDELIDKGYQVAWTYVSSAPVDTESPDCRAYLVEVSDAGQVRDCFEKVQTDFGRTPDCVVVNAGINLPPAPVSQFADESFEQIMKVNLFGAFNILKCAASLVQPGGTIIAVTTSMVRVGIPGGGPYTASKAAVEALIRSMAKELGPSGIRVNAVAPGPVDTDLFNSGKTDEAKMKAAAMSPLNRIGQPQEVAKVIGFLASDDASWVHGQIIQPNGGMV